MQRAIHPVSVLRRTLPLLLAVAACTPHVDDDDGADTPDPTAEPTGDPTTDEPTDPPATGETGLEPGITWTLGDEVVCADPSSREAAPYDLHQPGGDWAAQPFDPDSGSLFVGGGLGVGDLDGDGLLDLLITARDERVLLFRQTADLGFEDLSHRLPPMPERTAGVTLVDLDDDGDLDAFVTVFRGHDLLLINDGVAGFTEQAALWGVQGDAGGRTIGSSWVDMDHDGDLDGFVGGYGRLSSTEGLPPGDPSHLYRNQGGGRFVDVAGEAPMPPEAGPDDAHPFAEAHTFGGAWTDVDGDGWHDLYLVNDFGWTYPSLLVRNDGGVMRWGPPEGLESNAENMGLGIGDLNGDLVPDFLVTAWDVARLFVSREGAWYREDGPRSIRFDYDRGQRVAWGNELADLDNDGDLDAHVVFGHLPVRSSHVNPDDQHDATFLQQDDGQFVNVTGSWGLDQPHRGRGFVLVDLDRNGWLDLVKSDLRGPTTIHLARCGEAAWLGLRPRQDGANPFAVGATVYVRDGDTTWMRELRAGGTSYASSGPPEVHFGLGDRDTVDAVEIRWPDGERTVLEDVPTRRWIDVERRR